MVRMISVLIWLLSAGAIADDVQKFPNVIAAEATKVGNTWTVRATLSSPYDTPDRYADAFRVLTDDGIELGVRILWHDHANEQPFSRSLSGVAVPDDLVWVTIEGRDKTYGWGGQSIRLHLISGEQMAVKP